MKNKQQQQKKSHPADFMWYIILETLHTTRIYLHAREILMQGMNMHAPFATHIGRILVMGFYLS